MHPRYSKQSTQVTIDQNIEDNRNSNLKPQADTTTMILFIYQIMQNQKEANR
jgi:hypothetical protein